MKRFVALLAAAAVAAIVILHPAPAPRAASAGWSTEPSPSPRARARSPVPHALAYVAGEVVRPGVYPVPPGARVADALARAGGARPDADLVAVNLAAHVEDGDEIVVPAKGAVPSARTGAHGHGRKHPRLGGGAKQHGKSKHGRAEHRTAPPPAVVDVNAADAATLATIPGIGEGLAERIVAFREQNGPFASIDELLDVAGITEHRLDAIIPYVVAR